MNKVIICTDLFTVYQSILYTYFMFFSFIFHKFSSTFKCIYSIRYQKGTYDTDYPVLSLFGEDSDDLFICLNSINFRM